MHFSAAAMALLALPALVAPSTAQDARAVLEASGAAVREVPGFAAQFRLVGEGSEMIRNTMPGMNGRFVFANTEDGPLIHILGESRDSAAAPGVAFDLVRTPEQLIWTDDAKQTVFVRRATPDPREAPGAARLLHLTNLLDEQPFAALLERAESIEHEGTKEVAGETCEVVLVNLPKPGASARGRPSRAAGGHTAERWFISTDDRLPRRHEQITDAGMLKFSLVTEMSNLRVGEQPAEMLDVRRPESYKVDDNTRPVEEPDQPQPEQAAEPEPVRPITPPPVERATPALPQATMAPQFAFTPEGGSEVTNATQQGRVTVLYFWGTWCIPCRAVSPKISEMAERFADRPVDVFAPAIRERDPAAPKAYLAENEYQHRLVLGAEHLVSPFKVRVYPTVVVIGPTGEILYEAHPGPERTAEQLAEQTAAAVEKASQGL